MSKTDSEIKLKMTQLGSHLMLCDECQKLFFAIQTHMVTGNKIYEVD